MVFPRALLIVASLLTLFLLFGSQGLPMLFVLLASELGAILCAVGLWLLYREYSNNGLTPFRAVAAAGFLLLGLRFLSSGFTLLQQGFGG